MNPTPLDKLYRQIRLPTPTLDPLSQSRRLLQCVPRSRAARTPAPHRSYGWRGEHVLMVPPGDELFEWLHKGATEAASMVVGMPVEALTAAPDFWQANQPKALAFASDGVWGVWQRGPQNGVLLLWL